MKMLILLSLVAICAFAANPQTFCQSLSLDHVDGLVSGTTDQLETGTPITFHIRMTAGDDNIAGLTNGFRVYSPNGAEWTTVTADTTGVIGKDEFDLIWAIDYFSITGSVVDTVGFAGCVIMNPYGMPAYFDEITHTITIGPIGAEHNGRTICLDSSFTPPVRVWKWVTQSGDVLFPNWDGPHCFTVDPNYCCDIRGDIDHNLTIDISDLVWLINYIFLNGPEPPCFDEADINGDGSKVIDITDLIYFIDYIFLSGPEPVPCWIPPVTITTPPANAVIEGGAIQVVQWTQTGTPTTLIDIYYTLDGTTDTDDDGVLEIEDWTLVEIATDVQLGDETVNWNVPGNTPSDDKCRLVVKVASTGDSLYATPLADDYTISGFILEDPSTDALADDATCLGELLFGVAHDINYTAIGVPGNGNIWFSPSGFTANDSVKIGTGNAATFDWSTAIQTAWGTTAVEPCWTALIRIRGTVHTGTYATCDPFVYAGFIVTSQDGTTDLNVGSNYDITWETIGFQPKLDNVNLWYSIDNADPALATFTKFMAMANTGTWTWNVPVNKACQETAYTGVSAKDINTSRAHNATFFTIAGYEITAPLGGSTVPAGDCDITWDAYYEHSTLPNLKIEYSTNSGATWTVCNYYAGAPLDNVDPLSGDADIHKGAETWLDADLVSGGLSILVRLTAVSGSIWAINEAPFTWTE